MQIATNKKRSKLILYLRCASLVVVFCYCFFFFEHVGSSFFVCVCGKSRKYGVLSNKSLLCSFVNIVWKEPHVNDLMEENRDDHNSEGSMAWCSVTRSNRRLRMWLRGSGRRRVAVEQLSQLAHQRRIACKWASL
jgi:hypothetical protein